MSRIEAVGFFLPELPHISDSLEAALLTACLHFLATEQIESFLPPDLTGWTKSKGSRVAMALPPCSLNQTYKLYLI